MSSAAPCASCSTPSASITARFCCNCGTNLRQPCPYCDYWPELGGTDLSNGRCPQCQSYLRICTNEFCRRLNPVEQLKCIGCHGRLPYIIVLWPTASGPADGCNVSELQFETPITFTTESSLGPDLIGMVSNGTALGHFARGIKTLRTGEQLTLPGKMITSPGPVIGGGSLWIPRTKGIDRRGDNVSSESALAEDLLSHISADSFWIGIDLTGNVYRWNLNQTNANLVGTLAAPNGSSTLVAIGDKALGFSGNQVIVCTNSSINFNVVNNGVPIGAFISEHNYVILSNSDTVWLSRLDGSAKESWCSNPISASRVLKKGHF